MSILCLLIDAEGVAGPVFQSIVSCSFTRRKRGHWQRIIKHAATNPWCRPIAAAGYRSRSYNNATCWVFESANFGLHTAAQHVSGNVTSRRLGSCPKRNMVYEPVMFMGEAAGVCVRFNSAGVGCRVCREFATVAGSVHAAVRSLCGYRQLHTHSRGKSVALERGRHARVPNGPDLGVG